ncbi:MAG: phage portal protein, partial [Phycisphaerae bacterium]|nr:phage portal protein [Phycisphaerae bacterium]
MNASDIPAVTDGTAPLAINVWSGALGDPAGAVVNEYSVLSIPAFWSGVRFLSETLAGLPKSIFQIVGQAPQRTFHPQNKLLSRRPNQYTTPFTVFETWHSHALIHGNGYLFVARDQRTNSPIGYYNLCPTAVMPFRYDNQQWYLVRGGKDGQGRPQNLILPAADVLHLPGLGFDGMVGFPVVWLMYESLELARNSQRFASRYLKRGTQLQGSVEIPGTATKEQIDLILDRLRRGHSGIESEYSFTVLTGGAKLNNNTIPPEQSQLLQSRNFAVSDMCRILRVPPHIVYEMKDAKWGNIEQMSIEVVKYSLLPWVQKAEQELTLKLLTDAEQDAGYYVRYSVDALLRGDTTTQARNVLALVNGGVVTANEGRAALDLAPLPDPAASQLRIPVNNPVPQDNTPQDNGKPDAPPSASGEFAAFSPIIEDAVNRVEAKTAKAFANKSEKPKQELVIWCNVFAEEQAKYVADALRPVSQVIESATGATLAIERIAERYAASIRARGAGSAFKPLAQIIEES